LAVVPASRLSPRDSHDPLVHDLPDALSNVLGSLERPARVVIIETIPRSALGKVQRARLLEWIQTVDSSQ
jgi:acyl-coenzyme A synthetase/AMP-(fatty) acid ligase